MGQQSDATYKIATVPSETPEPSWVACCACRNCTQDGFRRLRMLLVWRKNRKYRVSDLNRKNALPFSASFSRSEQHSRPLRPARPQTALSSQGSRGNQHIARPVTAETCLRVRGTLLISDDSIRDRVSYAHTYVCMQYARGLRPGGAKAKASHRIALKTAL